MAHTGPSYPARSLFRLLKFLGVSQQDVVKHLGVTKGTVSQWANGRRLVPERHLTRIFQLINPKQEEFIRQAQTTWEDDPYSDASGQAIEDVETYLAIWSDWGTEMGAPILLTELAEACRALAPYGTDPTKLQAVVFSPEIVRLRDAFEKGLRTLRRIEQAFSSTTGDRMPPRIAGFAGEQLAIARNLVARLHRPEIPLKGDHHAN
jgi:transcriptional regulator with XRE-family HTH domain